MKKLLLASVVAATAIPAVQADTVLGVYAGAYSWGADYTGDVNDTDAGQVVDLDDDLGLSDEANMVLYIALEHPVPILPNIRVQHTALDTSAHGTLTRDFTFDDVQFSASENVATDMDFSHTDLTLYYEVLDNWVNLDLGLTARKFDGEIKIASSTESAQIDLNAVLPMLYVAAQFDLPLTGLSAGLQGNAIGYSGSSLIDLNGYVQYEFAFGLGLRGGYRNFKLELDDIDSIDSNITMSGPYAALTFHF